MQKCFLSLFLVLVLSLNQALYAIDILPDSSETEVVQVKKSKKEENAWTYRSTWGYGTAALLVLGAAALNELRKKTTSRFAFVRALYDTSVKGSKNSAIKPKEMASNQPGGPTNKTDKPSAVSNNKQESKGSVANTQQPGQAEQKLTLNKRFDKSLSPAVKRNLENKFINYAVNILKEKGVILGVTNVMRGINKSFPQAEDAQNVLREIVLQHVNEQTSQTIINAVAGYESVRDGQGYELLNTVLNDPVIKNLIDGQVAQATKAPSSAIEQTTPLVASTDSNVFAQQQTTSTEDKPSPQNKSVKNFDEFKEAIQGANDEEVIALYLKHLSGLEASIFVANFDLYGKLAAVKKVRDNKLIREEERKKFRDVKSKTHNEAQVSPTSSASGAIKEPAQRVTSQNRVTKSPSRPKPQTPVIREITSADTASQPVVEQVTTAKIEESRSTAKQEFVFDEVFLREHLQKLDLLRFREFYRQFISDDAYFSASKYNGSREDADRLITARQNSLVYDQKYTKDATSIGSYIASKISDELERTGEDILESYLCCVETNDKSGLFQLQFNSDAIQQQFGDKLSRVYFEHKKDNKKFSESQSVWDKLRNKCQPLEDIIKAAQMQQTPAAAQSAEQAEVPFQEEANQLDEPESLSTDIIAGFKRIDEYGMQGAIRYIRRNAPAAKQSAMIKKLVLADIQRQPSIKSALNRYKLVDDDQFKQVIEADRDIQDAIAAKIQSETNASKPTVSFVAQGTGFVKKTYTIDDIKTAGALEQLADMAEVVKDDAALSNVVNVREIELHLNTLTDNGNCTKDVIKDMLKRVLQGASGENSQGYFKIWDQVSNAEFQAALADIKDPSEVLQIDAGRVANSISDTPPQSLVELLQLGLSQKFMNATGNKRSRREQIAYNNEQSDEEDSDNVEWD